MESDIPPTSFKGGVQPDIPPTSFKGGVQPASYNLETRNLELET